MPLEQLQGLLAVAGFQDFEPLPAERGPFWKKRLTMSNQKPNLTTEEFEVRVWGFVVVVVTCILCFIVIALLYSVTFVTQPIKSMAPIDQAYTKMLNDIVLLIVGGIGGVMSKRAVAAGS